VAQDIAQAGLGDVNDSLCPLIAVESDLVVEPAVSPVLNVVGDSHDAVERIGDRAHPTRAVVCEANLVAVAIANPGNQSAIDAVASSVLEEQVSRWRTDDWGHGWIVNIVHRAVGHERQRGALR